MYNPQLSTFIKVAEILSICEVKTVFLQTELHSYLRELELKAYLKQNGIVPQLWYPLGHGDKNLLNEKVFADLANKYGKTIAQIILRWHIHDGNIVIPGSKNPDHIRADFDIFDFALTVDARNVIAAINKDERYYTNAPEKLEAFAKWHPDVEKQK